MASSSSLDPDNFPESGKAGKLPKGHDTKSLGPSDSSDSGSDMTNAGTGVGDAEMDGDSDRSGTGERSSAGKEPDAAQAQSEYDTDRVVGAEEAGLGGGLDQAEEAQLGITDEELDLKRRLKPQWPDKPKK